MDELLYKVFLYLIEKEKNNPGYQISIILKVFVNNCTPIPCFVKGVDKPTMKFKTYLV